MDRWDDRPLRRGGRPRPPRLGDKIIRSRFWLYAAALAAILAYRLIPGLAPPPPQVTKDPPPPTAMILSGLDLAPNLIPFLVGDYREAYPWVVPSLLPGGARKAIEDLINGRSDLAVLNRLPTDEENAIIATMVDSLQSFSIALGGIALVSAREGGRDSATVEALRAWVRGNAASGESSAPRLYVPDPNLGLWDALAGQLGTDGSPPPDVVWLVDERAVAQAAGADPGSIGIASTMALPADLDSFGVRLVAVRGDSAASAAFPYRGQIARGEYPLFHYLYLTMRPRPKPVASGFVTYVYSSRGQRLVQAQGFVPARQTARIIHLTSKPLG